MDGVKTGYTESAGYSLIASAQRSGRRLVSVVIGAASENLVNSPMRETRVKYRRPGGSEWEYISLEQASEMIADRVIAARRETWEEETENGEPLKRSLGIHFLGGATLDSEENYLIKKFFTAMGALSIENQARI